jgi:hypothetical protein
MHRYVLCSGHVRCRHFAGLVKKNQNVCRQSALIPESLSYIRQGSARCPQDVLQPCVWKWLAEVAILPHKRCPFCTPRVAVFDHIDSLVQHVGCCHQTGHLEIQCFKPGNAVQHKSLWRVRLRRGFLSANDSPDHVGMQIWIF